eukprot:CFRG1105T1
MYLFPEAYSEVYQLVLQAQRGAEKSTFSPTQPTVLDPEQATVSGHRYTVDNFIQPQQEPSVVHSDEIRQKSSDLTIQHSEHENSSVESNEEPTHEEMLVQPVIHSPLHTSMNYNSDNLGQLCESQDSLESTSNTSGLGLVSSLDNLGGNHGGATASAYKKNTSPSPTRVYPHAPMSPSRLKRSITAAKSNTTPTATRFLHAFSDSDDDDSVPNSPTLGKLSSALRSPGGRSRRVSNVSFTMHDDVHEVESADEYDRSAVDDHMRSSDIRNIITEVKRFVTNEMEVHPSSPSACEGSLIPVKNKARANIIAEKVDSQPSTPSPTRSPMAPSPTPTDYPSYFNIMM